MLEAKLEASAADKRLLEDIIALTAIAEESSALSTPDSAAVGTLADDAPFKMALVIV